MKPFPDIALPAEPMNDIHDTLSSGLPVGQVESASGVVDAVVPATPPPKPKRKRGPRPAYDDGALTRVFKFPSKKYPKSSYYVTNTDIIVRIKKARKKWKLVVPKKRVVSYRTNRWFAKPRWVELELTFTQASRLGLVDASTPAVQPDTSELPGEHDVEEVLSLDTASEPAAPDWLDGDMATGCADTEVDTGADVDPVADLCAGAGALPSPPESPDTAAEAYPEPFVVEPVAPRSLDFGTSSSSADAVAQPLLSVSLASEPIFSSQILSEQIISQQRAGMTPPPRPRRSQELSRRRTIDARAMAPALAMLILSCSAGWWPIADGTSLRVACSHPTQMSCVDHDIVTGSINTAGMPGDALVERNALPESLPDALPDAAREPNAEPPPMLDTEPAAATVTAGREVEIAAGNLSQGADAVEPPSPPQAFAAGIDRAGPDHVRPAGPIDPPKEDLPSEDRTALEPVRPAGIEPCPWPRSQNCPARFCDKTLLKQDTNERRLRLSASTEISTIIQFEFASASIPPQGQEALNRLAAALEQCPAVYVIIEGHTDTDGDFHRNQSLSVRRAEAVRQLLIKYGAGANQLSVAGFGQSRPLVPNDSDANKRRNRRIELVVE